MGLFDLIESVARETVKAVVRIPEVPIKIIKGVKDGVEEGGEEVVDAMNDLMEQ